MASLSTRSALLRHTILMVLSGLLTACATYIPDHIKNTPAENLTLTQVQNEPKKHQGKIIRWGGSIISTQNLIDKTQLTILAHTLNQYGEPQQGDHSHGRFIAIISGFLDPAIYAPGRAITVYGKFNKLLNKNIDSFEYHYPLVDVTHTYLWDVSKKYNYYDHPYWYDPWYPYYYPSWQRR